jgi:DNA-directed RNA polymerase subunit RPC12/RpoP
MTCIICKEIEDKDCILLPCCINQYICNNCSKKLDKIQEKNVLCPNCRTKIHIETKGIKTTRINTKFITVIIYYLMSVVLNSLVMYYIVTERIKCNESGVSCSLENQEIAAIVIQIIIIFFLTFVSQDDEDENIDHNALVILIMTSLIDIPYIFIYIYRPYYKFVTSLMMVQIILISIPILGFIIYKTWKLIFYINEERRTNWLVIKKFFLFIALLSSLILTLLTFIKSPPNPEAYMIFTISSILGIIFFWVDKKYSCEISSSIIVYLNVSYLIVYYLRTDLVFLTSYTFVVMTCCGFLLSLCILYGICVLFYKCMKNCVIEEISDENQTVVIIHDIKLEKEHIEEKNTSCVV